MTSQLDEALVEMVAFLDSHTIPYVLIGGMAAAVWGRARATDDVDFTIAVPPGEGRSFVTTVTNTFAPRRRGVPETVELGGVLLLKATNGVAVDLIVASTPFEEEVISRAVDTSFGGRTIKMATPEDIVLFKCIAGRAVDIEDVKGILRRRRDELDSAYIERYIDEFVEASGDEGIRQRYLDAVERTRPLEDDG